MALVARPFQAEAVVKLKTETNVLIGDEMGTGKTVEAILLDHHRREGAYWPARTLVVSPKAVTDSWRRHYAQWAPTRRVIVMDPKNRAPFMKAVKDGTHDVYIMHWDALRLEEDLTKVNWVHIIADEAHRMKNRKAQQTVALKRLKAKYKSALTGTPADNMPSDLWSILNWLYPSQYRSFNTFYDYHIIARLHNAGGDGCLVEDCGKYHRQSYKEVVGVHDAEGLQKQMEPYYVRRLKEDVLQDLPPKYYSEIHVDLHPKQRTAYNEMRDRMMSWLGEGDEEEVLAAPLVVSQLLRLQQFAVGYGKVIEKKMRKFRNGEWVNEMGRTLLLTEPSAKLDALMEVIDDNPTEQLVVFAQSRQLIDMFGTRMEKAKIKHGLYHGSVSGRDRDTIIDQFQAGDLQVFAGTIKAGGEGITLTAASTVVFVDRDWSPSKNNQTEDRLHRIGQPNAVHVIDLMANDTIDLGRHQRINTKRGMLRKLLGDPNEVRKYLTEEGIVEKRMTQ